MHTQKLWNCTQEADHIPGWQPLYSIALEGVGGGGGFAGSADDHHRVSEKEQLRLGGPVRVLSEMRG